MSTALRVHASVCHRYSTPEFLEMCNLRAFPFKQLRQLAHSLMAGTLKLQDAIVQMVVRSSLFHVG